MTDIKTIPTPAHLMALALALGARQTPAWSSAENEAASCAAGIILDKSIIEQARHAVEAGGDPLGDLFISLHTADERRPQGAVYTPPDIVAYMLDAVGGQGEPARVVDVGTGSGRFLVAAGRGFPNAELIGVDLDPYACILARGHLVAAGLATRAQIIHHDYRSINLSQIDGSTLYVGNPPYVRHHQIDEEWKTWLVKTAARHGVPASKLAGLHAHFFLATAEMARPGDAGVYITSSEWMDVNYGALVRELLLRKLGGRRLHVVEPTAEPFPGVQTTAVITEFEVGAEPATVGFRRVPTVAQLREAPRYRTVGRERLASTHRWSELTFDELDANDELIEIGELFRVHRGQVTGANRVWIQGADTPPLPESVLFPSVTRARELFGAGEALADTQALRRVIDLPTDLSAFAGGDARLIKNFLSYARQQGGDRGFIAEHRRAWWSVGLREAAPILVTYMARKPPAFVRNLAEARHINIAHGLYPREPLPADVLTTLARFLGNNVNVQQGRTYAGGLTKFEPREIERIRIPHPDYVRNVIGEVL